MLTFYNLRTGVIIALLALALTQIAVRARGVIQQIEGLSAAQQDNVQWTLSQAEVDFLQLCNAMKHVVEDRADLEEVRKRYDVFYSRIHSIEDGDAYAPYRDKGEFAAHLNLIKGFLDQSLARVDAPDRLLVSQIPDMLNEASEIERSARWLALSGLSISATAAETRRADMKRLVLQLLFAMALLILGLVALVVVLRRLNRHLRQAMETNRRSKAHLEAMVTTSLDGILVFNQSNQILEFNTAAVEIFGKALASASRPHMTDLLRSATGEPFVSPAVSGLVAQGRIRTEGCRLDGTTFPAEVAIAKPQLSDDNDVYIACIRDISDQQNTEAALLRARDTAQAGEKAKANLLAVMSHEIRTPLNGILGAAELLKTTQLSPKQRGLLDAMDTSGNVLMRHVNDVLDISRLDAKLPSSPREEFDLHALIRELVDSQSANAMRTGNTLSASISKSVPQYTGGEPRKLQQALLNLIGNAVKFTKNGQIIVEVDHFGQEDMIEFRVIDTGIGIADGELDQIFEDFFAIDTTYGRHQQGTGLGLSITRRLVASMGGEIGAESLLEEGSLFWFRIPLQRTSVPSKDENRSLGKAAPDERYSILLVEDNPINRMITGEMLNNIGHDVTLADDGASGVSKAYATKFDLILMDISMPGMDGVTAAEHIRQGRGRSCTSPIVALTAQVLEAELTQIKAVGIQDVLTKPISTQALAFAVANSIQTQPSTYEQTGPSTVHDLLLREDIITDVIENIGVERTKRHHQQLRDQIELVIRDLGDPTVTAENAKQDVHNICGAAAVLGLCRLHRHLSKVEPQITQLTAHQRSELSQATQSVWQASDQILATFINSWAQQANEVSITQDA